MVERLADVLALRELGWNVVPAPPKGKSPLGSWKRWQTERVPERVVREAFSKGDNNVFVITGSVSRLAVLDCDDEASVKYWRERLGEILEKTARVKTDKGWHFYFRLEPGQVERGRSSSDPNCKWDLRVEGGGVVAPPSVHKSGRKYEWAEGHGPESIEGAPGTLFERTAEEGESGARSILTHLLENPPQAEGGRNNWLAQVAGHFARHIPHQDAYETMVRDAAGKLKPELPEEEIAKLVRSIWDAEQAKEGKAVNIDPESEDDKWREALAEPAEETGWLVSGATCILVQTKGKQPEGGYEIGLARWMNADLKVIGVVETPDGSRTYEVELLKGGGEAEQDILPASTTADPRKLAAWLADHGVSVGPPDTMWPAKMKESARLLRYMEAQGAETLEAVPALGWHEESEAFITHEGVIRSSGPAPFEHVRPDLTARKWAPYRYGHAGKSQAQEALGEVLTFHHETVAAVFGSWWASCLLKPQITTVSSQFPFMALEASSESGKTTGFFSLMLALSGNSSGHTNPTRAALRDYLSAHRSGIVWMDDLDSLDNHGELLRAVTGEGAIVKKGSDHQKQVVAQLRAALAVSGEALGLSAQKALLDRAVLLEVPSPIGRRSKADPTRPQWDDVLELKSKYPDLTDLAGSVVELALEQEGLVSEFKTLRPGAGRFADKVAVVRLGARILASMLKAGDWIIEKADAWAAGEVDLGAENALTLKLLPLALARTGWKQKPEGPHPATRTLATPVFCEDDEVVWFSPQLLADWWEREVRQVDNRTESAGALEQQARAAGMGGEKGKERKLFRYVTGEGRQTYWRVPRNLSMALLDRSRGIDQEHTQEEELWHAPEK